ncbi:MAG: ComEC/Rec2 family competence protein [Chloroflexi bacterium]|nr:ComEC/Rec2 family competence protein [Chloroflexota bacterium]
MRHPLLMVALFYAGGMVLGRYCPWPVPLTLLFAAGLGLAIVALGKTSWRAGLIGPLLIVTGWTNLCTRTAILSPSDLRLLIREEVEYVTLRGTLLETPTYRIFERGEREERRSLARIEVIALGRSQQWQPAFGRVAASTPGLLGPEFFAGQSIEVTGLLRRPKGPAADGLFDYRAYLQWQGIYRQLQVESTNDWQIVRTDAQDGLLRSGLETTNDGQIVRTEAQDGLLHSRVEATNNGQIVRTVDSPVAPPWADRFQNWAQATLARSLPGPDEAVRLLWALSLGWKTALTDEVSEPFMRTGTLHVFAISGLHIALIAGILVSLLRVAQLSRGKCGLVVIPLIWFYTAATGWQSSAIRSTIMMSVVIAGWSLKRPHDLLNSLAAAGFIILLWEPQQLFQASFQLSFSVVMSIALMLPPLEQLRQRLLQTDPFLPPELRPRWQRWLDGPLHYLSTSLATSLAAWLGALPLIAHYFYLVTPVSLLANLIIVPLSSLALMTSLGSLICGHWAPPLTELFNQSGWLWMRCMVLFSEWAARLPGAYFYVRPPTLGHFAVYYLLLAGVLTGWLFKPAVRRWAALTMMLLGLLGLWHWHKERTEVRLTVLPMSGGVVFVDAPGRRNDLLVDCGNASGAEFVAIPFLRAQGVNRLRRLLLTHGDLAHVGGAETLAGQFAVEQFVTSPARFRSRAYRQIVENLAQSPQRWQPVRRGERLGLWTVLHPEEGDRFAQADDSAVVLAGEIHGTRVLLLSDLGKRGQQVLLEREKDLRADIVVAGLPAQDEPLNGALLQAIQPRIIIVSTADFPASDRGSNQLRKRLSDVGVPVLYVHETGAVTLGLGKQGWEITSMAGHKLIGQSGTAARH